MNKCIFCDSQFKKIENRDPYSICDCPICGHYEIGDAAMRLDKEIYNKRHLISGYIREMNDTGSKVKLQSEKNYKVILDSPMVPKDIQGKINKIIQYFNRNIKEFGQFIKIPEISVSYSKNEEENKQLYMKVIEKGYIESDEIKNSCKLLDTPIFMGFSYSLTIEGKEYADKIIKGLNKNNQVFVSMWFNSKNSVIYKNFIKKAIKESGYEPYRVDDDEFNQAIIDVIIGEIRKSKFVIVDLTGQRPNVYYEAGFAYGLNLAVIYTCNKDDKEKSHFNVNHNKIIYWEDGEDLYNQLKNRITATILK